MKNLPRLLLFILLLVTPVQTDAQPAEYSRFDEQPRIAVLDVRLDPWGPARVNLWISKQVQNRQELERSLAESFSFPLQIREGLTTEDEADPFYQWATQSSSRGWTILHGENPSPFNGIGFSCFIDPVPLGEALRSQNIEDFKIQVEVDTANDYVSISSNRGSEKRKFQHMHIHLASPVYYVLEIRGGAEPGDVMNGGLTLVVFLLLPVLLTMAMNRRRFNQPPAELWGWHLRFSNRLHGILWPIWLCVYSLSSLPVIVTFAIRRPAIAQIVNLAFYFVPPVAAMFLCHFASRGVYRRVTGVAWSASDVVRRAMIMNTFALAPLFVLVLALNTLSTDPRQSALYVVLWYFGWMLLYPPVEKAFGPKLHAVTSGDLRNRVFELSHKAGVALKQIYVLAEEQGQLLNAFARSDDSVMMTNSVLKHLTRREVDGTMAHEIAHLKGKHPQGAQTTLIVTVVIVQVLGHAVTTFIGLNFALPIVFSVAIVSGMAALFFVSRRNERQADAIGVSLTGDPEAFISGLAKLSRLNLMPLHSGGWGEMFETHPSTLRRLETIARTYGIPDDRFQTLISDSYTSQESSYPAIDPDQEVIFSSELKKRLATRNALIVLCTILLTPLPFALVLPRVSGVWLLIVPLAGFIASFGVYQIVRNLIAFWGHPPLSVALRTRLEKRGLVEIARNGTFVGLAPAAHSRKYENFPFWDIGLLWLTDEKLYYFGEQAEFALERGEVHDVYVEDANPEWLSEKNLFVIWSSRRHHVKDTLHFLALQERSILKARRAIDFLKERLEAWRYQPHSFPPAPAEMSSIDEPNFPEITSAPAIKVFKPAVFKVAAKFAFYGAFLGYAFGRSWLGVSYMAVVVFLTTVLDELPKTFKRKVLTTEPPFKAPDYAPGSWADSNTEVNPS
ncbi:MAG TPA: M48 family metalloprotease [Pyrinomonadaceae bacterium]